MCKRRKLSVFVEMFSNFSAMCPCLDPEVPQTAISVQMSLYFPKKKQKKKTGCWCKVETWCLKSTVPETQFGLKLPVSCFDLPLRGLNLEETSSLPLSYSDVTLMSPWCPDPGEERVIDCDLCLDVLVISCWLRRMCIVTGLLVWRHFKSSERTEM